MSFESMKSGKAFQAGRTANPTTFSTEILVQYEHILSGVVDTISLTCCCSLFVVAIKPHLCHNQRHCFSQYWGWLGIFWGLWASCYIDMNNMLHKDVCSIVKVLHFKQNYVMCALCSLCKLPPIRVLDNLIFEAVGGLLEYLLIIIVCPFSVYGLLFCSLLLLKGKWYLIYFTQSTETLKGLFVLPLAGDEGSLPALKLLINNVSLCWDGLNQ